MLHYIYILYIYIQQAKKKHTHTNFFTTHKKWEKSIKLKTVKNEIIFNPKIKETLTQCVFTHPICSAECYLQLLNEFLF